MKIKNRQQMLLILAATAVALFVADKVVLSPLSASWQRRAKIIADLRKQVADGRQLLRRQNSLHETWAEMRTNTLPNNSSLAEQTVLKAFDRWSQDTRVTLTALSPQWKHDADEFQTLECRVEASGTLERLARFLFAIENDPMALKLETVELTSRDTDGQQLALGLQVSALVLTTQEKRP